MIVCRTLCPVSPVEEQSTQSLGGEMVQPFPPWVTKMRILCWMQHHPHTNSTWLLNLTIMRTTLGPSSAQSATAKEALCLRQMFMVTIIVFYWLYLFFTRRIQCCNKLASQLLRWIYLKSLWFTIYCSCDWRGSWNFCRSVGTAHSSATMLCDVCTYWIIIICLKLCMFYIHTYLDARRGRGASFLP